jgi:hypothetical protein
MIKINLTTIYQLLLNRNKVHMAGVALPCAPNCDVGLNCNVGPNCNMGMSCDLGLSCGILLVSM